MLKVKNLYLETRIAFGASGLPLKRRSQEELIDLAILARTSNDQTLQVLFVELPELADLRKMKMRKRVLEINAKKTDEQNKK